MPSLRLRSVPALCIALLLPACSWNPYDTPPPPKVFRLESPGFADAAPLPQAFTCDGEGVSPPLLIRDVPDGTRSVALVLDDLDAPSGHYVHWVFWDLAPSIAEIPQGSVPNGAMEGTNSAGDVGYAPPCPPPGKAHRYVFHLYAVNDAISLSFEATRAVLEQNMKGKVLAIAKLTGMYERREE